MKRELRCLSAMLMMALSIACFVSCSSDDDSIGGGSASTTTGVLDELNKRVKSVYNCTFYYKDNGLLDYVAIGGYNRIEFTYNPNKIVCIYDGEEVNSDIVVTYNGLGYIARVDETYIEEDEKVYTGQSTRSYTYNKSGCLTSIKGSYKDKSNDGDLYEGTVSVLLTWENGLLLSAVCEENWQEMIDGRRIRGRDIDTYSFDYDNAYYNKYYQYAPSVLDPLDFGGMVDECLRYLAYVGLMGKGPLYLPVNCVKTSEFYEEGEDEEDYNHSYTFNYSYGFNSDGSIDYTKNGSRRYNFGYEHLNSANRAPVATSPDGSMSFRKSSSPVRQRKSRLLKRVNN